MKRCKQCNAPLTINGTHCNRCQAPRDDLEEQEYLRRKRSVVVTFLAWILGTFFSVTMLLWFLVCDASGATAGYFVHLAGMHQALCWMIGVVVTVFLYGLSWLIVIYGD